MVNCPFKMNTALLCWCSLFRPMYPDNIMWFVFTSRSGLLCCHAGSISTSLPHQLFFLSSSDSHPSSPWWAAWFAGECVIWILTSLSVYQPDSLDVAAQKFLFSFLSTVVVVVVPPNPNFFVMFASVITLLSQISSCNHLSNLHVP